MIVDVANLDLDVLRCYLAYALGTLAQSFVYGIQCNVDELRANICKVYRWLWIADHCPSEITDEVFCGIQDCITWASQQYVYTSNHTAICSEETSTTCDLTITQSSSSCTAISINIL